MSNRPFFAIFPQHLKEDDEIIIKGKVKDDAKEFSINFTLDITPTPSYIAYHFKTIFDANVVVQNYKDQCMWNDEEISPNEWINGPGSIPNPPELIGEPINDIEIIPIHLLLGESFGLAFNFKESEILIYSLEDEYSRNLIYTFKHQLDFDKIQTIQAWGDVEKITELAFRYA